MELQSELTAFYTLQKAIDIKIMNKIEQIFQNLLFSETKNRGTLENLVDSPSPQDRKSPLFPPLVQAEGSRNILKRSYSFTQMEGQKNSHPTHRSPTMTDGFIPPKAESYKIELPMMHRSEPPKPKEDTDLLLSSLSIQSSQTPRIGPIRPKSVVLLPSREKNVDRETSPHLLLDGGQTNSPLFRDINGSPYLRPFTRTSSRILPLVDTPTLMMSPTFRPSHSHSGSEQSGTTHTSRPNSLTDIFEDDSVKLPISAPTIGIAKKNGVWRADTRGNHVSASGDTSSDFLQSLHTLHHRPSSLLNSIVVPLDHADRVISIQTHPSPNPVRQERPQHSKPSKNQNPEAHTKPTEEFEFPHPRPFESTIQVVSLSRPSAIHATSISPLVQGQPIPQSGDFNSSVSSCSSASTHFDWGSRGQADLLLSSPIPTDSAPVVAKSLAKPEVVAGSISNDSSSEHFDWGSRGGQVDGLSQTPTCSKVTPEQPSTDSYAEMDSYQKLRLRFRRNRAEGEEHQGKVLNTGNTPRTNYTFEDAAVLSRFYQPPDSTPQSAAASPNTSHREVHFRQSETAVLRAQCAISPNNNFENQWTQMSSGVGDLILSHATVKNAKVRDVSNFGSPSSPFELVNSMDTSQNSRAQVKSRLTDSTQSSQLNSARPLAVTESLPVPSQSSRHPFNIDLRNQPLITAQPNPFQPFIPSQRRTRSEIVLDPPEVAAQRRTMSDPQVDSPRMNQTEVGEDILFDYTKYSQHGIRTLRFNDLVNPVQDQGGTSSPSEADYDQDYTEHEEEIEKRYNSKIDLVTGVRTYHSPEGTHNISNTHQPTKRTQLLKQKESRPSRKRSNDLSTYSSPGQTKGHFETESDSFDQQSDDFDVMTAIHLGSDASLKGKRQRSNKNPSRHRRSHTTNGQSHSQQFMSSQPQYFEPLFQNNTQNPLLNSSKNGISLLSEPEESFSTSHGVTFGPNDAIQDNPELIPLSSSPPPRLIPASDPNYSMVMLIDEAPTSSQEGRITSPFQPETPSTTNAESEPMNGFPQPLQPTQPFVLYSTQAYFASVGQTGSLTDTTTSLGSSADSSHMSPSSFSSKGSPVEFFSPTSQSSLIRYQSPRNPITITDLKLDTLLPQTVGHHALPSLLTKPILLTKSDTDHLFQRALVGDTGQD
ncbi:hypothetical protein BLNAU_7029 [Blattamonas nauphoetae]|uniref:Uncharacterized protein n=1 Tax=Blattamonas nauphoetae TaxID=2049346 RepID=A0ABQ9Y2Y1_9EUKA|nr:hypothetical protein BLNAU_7029 [Blattamonas nauphoetae]